MAKYLAQDGTPITEAMIDQWALEAENAFQDADVTVTPFEGRPWETKTSPMRPRTIRLPDALWALIEAKAEHRHLTVSEYTRQALAQVLANA